MKLVSAGVFAALLSTSALAQTEKDLVVGPTALVQRCSLKGYGSRMIAVGQPGGFNFAFDAVSCAPVVAWSGQFLDMTGETDGRGGNGCKALGVPVPLCVAQAPFRVANPEKLPESVVFRGYRREAKTGVPTFAFEVDGVSVEQKLTSAGPDEVRIDLSFPEGLNNRVFYLLDPTPHARAQLGEGLRWSGTGVLEIGAGGRAAVITLQLKPSTKAFVRKAEEPTGAELFGTLCSACHSIDGTRLIGPTLKGLWGREETVTRNGKTEALKVGADYIRESILEPQAAIVQGYEQVPMASFGGVLTKAQVERLILYLRSLE